MRDVQQYRINSYKWPIPDTTTWEDVQAGEQLSTALPVVSSYRRHTWRYAVLPECGFPVELESIRNSILTLLVTDPPANTEEPTRYTDARCVGIKRSTVNGYLRGVDINFLVLVT